METGPCVTLSKLERPLHQSLADHAIM